jgi:hypothetical protein
VTALSTLALFCLLATIGNSTRAQTVEATPPIQIGFMGGLTLSRSGIDYQVSGSEHFLAAGSRFAIVTDIPFARHTAAQLGISYYTLGFRDRNTRVNVSAPGLPDRVASIVGAAPLETEGTLHFITLLLMFRYRVVSAGINFCTPLSSHVGNALVGKTTPSAKHDDGTVYPIVSDITPGVTERSVMVEARLAVEAPVLHTRAGTLYVGGSVSYPFATMLDSPILSHEAHVAAGTLPVLYNNFRMPSAGLSLAWMFAL